ncbi:MAG: hypothetical protein LDL13_01920 [Calditerrivibrio sp.]|nr:hypothetical protein [Calditerrivibrio sp.]MCA1932318.1 hypothetical protein [Calditerrivibrio sp.]MCA1980810.1 hypothetical protein [Calditerrivibrio sp.]
MKMGNSILNDDFVKLAKKLNVSYKGSSINPLKFYKNVDGKNIPVYFIGTPGLFVAITATILAVLFMVFFNISVSFWIWIIFITIAAIFLRISSKIDKARQIRMLSNDMILKSYESLLNYEKNFDKKFLEDAKFFLGEALKWIEDKTIEAQFQIVCNNIEDNKQ